MIFRDLLVKNGIMIKNDYFCRKILNYARDKQFLRNYHLHVIEVAMEEKPLFIKVTKAEYIKDYILRLTFNDGTVKLCDFLPLAQEGIFQKLKNLDYFKNFTLDPWTVDWNNEIGFAPEFLYEVGTAA